jgi:hypothetical protein
MAIQVERHGRNTQGAWGRRFVGKPAVRATDWR